MSNNKNKSAISLQESWASDLSDYILLRRQQTHVAYDAADVKTNDESKKVGKSEDSDLFTTLFVILAAHLEEGHTVLTIDAADHEAPMQGQINGEDVKLYAWQQQLLEILATPIFALIDTQIKTQIDTQPDDDMKTEVSLFVLLDTLFGQREYLWAQLALSNHEKETLIKRFDAITLLYQRLKNSDLNTFVHSIYEHALFANVDTNTDGNNYKNSLSKNNQPIIYNIAGSEEAEKSRITFWLHRTWQAEFNLAQHINHILSQQIVPLDIVTPKNLNDQQIAAINVANNNSFSIITGGPGTGKTYTVAQLVIALQQATESRGDESAHIRFSTDSASLALAAPTGKAAQRMQESLQAALDDANVDRSWA